MSTLISLLAITSAFAQIVKSESLKLTIKEQTLTIDSTSNTLLVTITLSNESDHEVIVYGLPGDLQAAPMPLSDLCRPDVGTGFAIGIYNEEGTQEMPMVHMAKQQAYKMPDSVRNAGEAAFVKSKMVMAKGESRSFAKSIPLGEYYLENGIYSLEIIYYCGKSISNVLNVKKVNKGKAMLFQGCTLSKRISLVVR